MSRRTARAVLGLAAALVVVTAGCGGAADSGGAGTAGSDETGTSAAGPADAGASKLSVLTDNYPLSYFAGRIGGDVVSVDFPASPDVDPSFWTPDAATIARYQEADLILVNGGGYAHWIDTATLPGSRVIDTSAAHAGRLLKLEGAITHSHGGEGEHSHTGYATTQWLDPTLAVEQAVAIAEAMKAARPGSGAAFDAGLAALRHDLEALDARLAAVAQRIGPTPLLFSHPVYDYLIHRYGLAARSLHWEPDEVPDATALAQLDALLAEHPARWILWEAEPLPETRALLKARGMESLVFAPCANQPATGDYVTVMTENVSRLEAAFPVD